MTTGLNATVANSILSLVYKATSFAGYASVYVKLHTGDPGSAGTANASGTTTRQQATFGTASSGSLAASEVTWTSWAAGSETVTHISLWDASTSGNFIQSGALSSSVAMTNGSTLGVTVTVSQSPIAA